MRLDPPALLAASTIVAAIGLILLAVSATGIEALLGPSLGRSSRPRSCSSRADARATYSGW